jgi:hypothetical protein
MRVVATRREWTAIGTEVKLGLDTCKGIDIETKCVEIICKVVW